MKRNLVCLCAISLAMSAGSVARADLLIDSNFDNPAGWTIGGADQMVPADIGSDYGNVLIDPTTGSSLHAYNSTFLPLYMTLDLDFLLTSVGSADPFVIGLHIWGSQSNPLAMPSGPLLDHNGYFITVSGTDDMQVIQLLRRNGPNPVDLAIVGETPYWGLLNDQPHHLSIADCGCGRIGIFLDHAELPALYVDDKYNYIGRTGTRIGLEMVGGAAGWVDNVVVEGDPVYIPEPATLLLMLVGAAGFVRRITGLVGR